jgi:hypothetical protein
MAAGLFRVPSAWLFASPCRTLSSRPFNAGQLARRAVRQVGVQGAGEKLAQVEEGSVTGGDLLFNDPHTGPC